ncbi:phosphoglucomutase-2 [Gregarina niphandrodes]|uniref:Phosphoglucomutase-2 n=1 Tax=Gregarina niphandrodes TaxID=110365 RepID=A0A023B780_GRENI|nr:phosphoglucomutase-2 [Gregarina niphandrodes]EZG67002.1 phosphoglucomutase-2 [Gregarina niphandrodes]|eukprot:XP_011130389.1 phosphoglucomutase-2 [Gregarina niphandrodes]
MEKIGSYTENIDEYLSFERQAEYVVEAQRAREDPVLAATLFKKRIAFGTAGLRGPMRAGISGMNVGTVWRATQGLCEYFMDKFGLEECRSRGAVIGFDGRHNSEYLASVAAAVFLSREIPVFFADEVTATPVTPYVVVKAKAVCGVQVTASHNPKEDNGYKVYADNGAQIIPPMDRDIASLIEQNKAPWPEVEGIVDHHLRRLNPLHPRRSLARMELPQYWAQFKADATAALKMEPGEFAKSSLKVVYTAMHGVGYRFVRDLLVDTLGFPATQFEPVPGQMHPDPEFPTVRFPNPEEAGALDLAKAHARATGADLIIANDPDADRFAAVEVCSDGSFRTFTGDELGVMLGIICYENLTGQTVSLPNGDSASTADLSFVCSAVSSKFFERFAARQKGVVYRETLTGFKWMVNVALAMAREGVRPCFCYEEALGYGLCVEAIPDKCGLTAAAAMTKKASQLKATGQTLSQWLEGLMCAAGGYFATDNSYFRASDPAITKAIVGAFRDKHYGRGADGSHQVAGYKVIRVRDLGVNYDSSTAEHTCVLPAGDDMLTLEFANGARLTLRGSGTEPKLKYYSEMTSQTSIQDAKEQLGRCVRAVLKEILHPYKLEHAIDPQFTD